MDEQIFDYGSDPIGLWWTKLAKERHEQEKNKSVEEKLNEGLPKISQNLLKETLPPLVTNYLSRYEDYTQKDVFVLSFITLMSGILPNYYVLHDGDEFTTNLNIFITAPAGSGKSAMSHAARFFNNIDLELTTQFNDEVCDDEKESKNVMQKTLFIPGNTSSAAITKCLNSNGGRGIICETEADTLGNILTKDWANFDDILRKSFHNEPITMSRAGLTNIVKIPSPALSVVLTGTPKQVVKLIPSTENGLFSRFLYYYFKSEDHWRNVFSATNKENNISAMATDISEVMTAIYFDRLEDSRKVFKWTDEQAKELDKFFGRLLDDSTSCYGSGINSVVYRLGLMASRLGAIIMYLNSTWNRLTNSEEMKDVMVANDKVFTLVKHIIEVQLEHSKYVFTQLPKSTDKIFSESGNRETFFNLLPNKFSRRQAVEVFAPKVFIKTRTADGYLQEFLKSGKLKKDVEGNYVKPD